MIYWQLFLSFLQIGALSFGGGYAAMPLIEAQIVTSHGWLTTTEFADLVTIAEMTPGPIAVNAATFVGTKIGGILGALAATAGCILPACVLVTLIAGLYLKYRDLSVLQSVLGTLRPAVVAMIASAGVSILLNAFWGGGTIALKETNVIMVGIFVLCFVLLRRTKWSPIAVMVLAGVLNLAISMFP
ncbi:chromate transporter [Pseudoflavonifractor sp. MSJ-30]|uniref:chromate transporter n=1 Tax=Pseudoflavonifractor sp. MSJ-30 TaxID=2841525 RepID=UPI001C0FB4D0|nr:chromate transporter [Pseudoflavonifractor sp. MSJ-30]MBU5453205.1 chromate transporter [Pseudoflavonifractor sp. MSJ-30]